MADREVRPWTILGAPLDSSGKGRGEENAPRALRDAGIVDRLAADDAGDIKTRIRSDKRDPRTGLIGSEHVHAASAELRETVGKAIREGRRPLVIGGDCTLLIGITAALADRWERPGLWFVDGHLDFYDGTSSPTGETADMDLAIVTGAAPPVLADARRPSIAPRDVVVLGHRTRADSDSPEELEMVDPEVELIDAPTVIERRPGRVGEEAEARLGQADSAWLHLDLDVLSEDSLAAVTYHQPGGLSWEQLEMLVQPLAQSPLLAGISVADLNADLDPDGAAAQRVVALLAELTKED